MALRNIIGLVDGRHGSNFAAAPQQAASAASRRARWATAFLVGLMAVACTQGGGLSNSGADQTDRVFLAGQQEISDL
ncbi:MAG: hypothetical protein AB7O45_16835, partial [Alphaproteobacteria bacterium]